MLGKNIAFMTRKLIIPSNIELIRMKCKLMTIRSRM